MVMTTPYTGFVPISQATSSTPIPGASPATDAIVRSVGRAIPGAIRSAPMRWVGRVHPALAATVIVEPMVQEAWQQWLGENIPANYEIPAPVLPPGTSTLAVRQVSRWVPINGGAPVIDQGSTVLAGVVSVFRGFHIANLVGSFQEVAMIINYGNGDVRPAILGGSYSSTAFQFDGFIEAFVGPAPTADPFVTPSPQIAPADPNQNVPYITIPVTVPAVPGVIPAPVPMPVVVPEPARVPYSPVPVVPASPAPGTIPITFPPMWLTPTGIQVGTPPENINFPSNGGIPETLPEPERERQRDRVGTGVLPCCPCEPGGGCDCEDIRKIMFEELDKKTPPKRPTQARVNSFPSAQSKVIFLPEYTQKVALTLTQIPTNARTQDGVDASDVIYAGWNSFDNGERIPVHYQDCVFYPPSGGAETWSYTLQSGFLGSATVYYNEAAD